MIASFSYAWSHRLRAGCTGRLVPSTVLLIAAATAGAQGPVLGIEGVRFTLDGKPAFMLGCSYYGALGMEASGSIEEDLDELRSVGFNWIRIWVTWTFDDFNMSAVTPDGEARPPYMDRLKRICTLAGSRGMVVDVTVSRGEAPFPSDQAQHLAVVQRLASELKVYRNVYFDVGNERDVGDARHVPSVEVGELIGAVKAVDPERLCTASSVPEPDTVEKFLTVARMDFLAPHLSREADSPGQTAGYTRGMLEAMRALDRNVPILYQEPFRRDYARWQPQAEDFMTDLIGALDGGAAGWCFHNGATRSTDDRRPRRSFDMRGDEGRLMKQLDSEERRFLASVKEIKPRIAQWGL